MSVMIQAPAAENVETAATPSADIPAQQDTEPATESVAEAVAETVTEAVSEAVTATVAEASAETVSEPPPEADVDRAGEDKSDEKSRAKPKRKAAPRKAAGTKSLVVLREGRVQFADTDTVVVVDLDEAAAPDTDVHDVLDRLTELRDAVECPGKAEAIKALTDLIQEKALG